MNDGLTWGHRRLTTKELCSSKISGAATGRRVQISTKYGSLRAKLHPASASSNYDGNPTRDSKVEVGLPLMSIQTGVTRSEKCWKFPFAVLAHLARFIGVLSLESGLHHLLGTFKRIG